MSKIPITIGLTTDNLERLDVLVRRGRAIGDHVLSGRERNDMLDLAIEFGLRHLEDLMPDRSWGEVVHDTRVPTLPAPSVAGSIGPCTINIVNSMLVDTVPPRRSRDKG
ncbi:MAG: hypothetical protein HY898_33475 [Deltaproteobacteria bacterium]|nr:hypothetical protein [Deltaproteobacteria bacterium]